MMSDVAFILLFSVASQNSHLPPGLLSALCFVESSHNPNAVNLDDGKGSSLGMCQIKLATARTLGFNGTQAELMQPKTNIELAGKYLKKQLRRYNGDFKKGISAYNSGTCRIDSSGHIRNKQYVNKVLTAWIEGR